MSTSETTQVLRELTLLSAGGWYTLTKDASETVLTTIEGAMRDVSECDDNGGGTLMYMRALERCVQASGAVLGQKKWLRLKRALKEFAVARARLVVKRTRFDNGCAMDALSMDVLIEILSRCDVETLKASACVSKDFREAAAIVAATATTHANADDFPRVRCLKCKKYMWRSQMDELSCLSSKHRHTLGETLRGGLWKYAFRRELRRRRCRYIDEDSDDSSNDNASSSEEDDNDQSESTFKERKFWTIGRS